MKTTLVTALILLTTTFAFSSCKDSSYTPPKNVVSAFKAKYPSAKRVEWEVKNTYQVAEFHIDFTEVEAWFDNNGQWVMTESDIKYSSLPVVIRNSFESGEYGKWEVEDVDKLERSGMETIYIIEAELGEQEVALHYLENGTLVKTLMDNGRGYQPESAPQAVLQFIQQKYPQANIVEIDQDKGVLKIDIMDKQIMKEVVFNHQNQWVVTTWEIPHNNVPANVMNVLKTSSYANYRIDDIDYEERADGSLVYIFEVEQGDREFDVTIDANNLKIISAIPKQKGGLKNRPLFFYKCNLTSTGFSFTFTSSPTH